MAARWEDMTGREEDTVAGGMVWWQVGEEVAAGREGRLAGHGSPIYMMQVVDRKMEPSVPQAQAHLFTSADAGLWLDLPIACHGRGNRSHP